MSLAMTDASTQRVLWKLWHDNRATPIIFQMQSRNITALHCEVSHKAQGQISKNIQVPWLNRQSAYVCVPVIDTASLKWIWIASTLLSAFHCLTFDGVNRWKLINCIELNPRCQRECHICISLVDGLVTAARARGQRSSVRHKTTKQYHYQNVGLLL